MTVWIDLLILDNFCADASLLYCAVKTVRGEAKPLRILLTALLGTALGVGYTVFRLYYTVPQPVEVLMKYGVAAVLPWLAFRAKRRRAYAVCSLAFLAYMSAFAGILTALFGSPSPEAGDTLVYTVEGLPSGVLVGAAVLFALLAARVGRMLARRARAAAVSCRCKLVRGGKCVTVRALVDTGNRLCDRRGRGVPVVDPVSVLDLFGGSFFDPRAFGGELAVTTVNGASSLRTFRIDALEIYYAGRTHIIKDVTVALGSRPLAGEYGMILPASFTEEGSIAKGGKGNEVV